MKKYEIFFNYFFLDLLLLQAMFEGNEARPLHTVELLVVQHDDHALRDVEGLANVELEVLELRQKRLHDAVDVCLKSFHLVPPVVLLKVLDDPLHVELQVILVLFLVTEKRFTKPMVQDDIDTGHTTFVAALISILALGAGVGSGQYNFSLLSGLVLSIDLIDTFAHQFHRVGVGKQLIAGENILVDLHDAGENG